MINIYIYVLTGYEPRTLINKEKIYLKRLRLEIIMAERFEMPKIEKLNGKNYKSWKYNTTLVLMERGLWGFIKSATVRAF